MSGVKVKICGITSFEDAVVCKEAGADAIGFVFYGRSPRYISPEAAGRISSRLPQDSEKIGVFVDETPEDILSAVCRSGLTAVQLHGKESPDICARLAGEIRVVKAFPLSCADDVGKVFFYEHIVPLFDTAAPEFGGSGRTFSWEYLVPHREKLGRFILSGGLTAENVAQAIATAHPFMVDVSSGVEISPGKKDPEKIKAFIKAVKGTKPLTRQG